MNDWTQIGMLLLQFYVAFGIMAIGFGVMFAGKHGAARAAHFYFAGSLRWTLGHVWGLLTAVLATAWTGTLSILAFVAHHLWHGVRWLSTHERRPPNARRAPGARPASRIAERVRAATAQVKAAVKEFVQRHVGFNSLPFLIALLCIVPAIFVVCLLLLRSGLGR
jgi:hypothetical protein